MEKVMQKTNGVIRRNLEARDLHVCVFRVGLYHLCHVNYKSSENDEITIESTSITRDSTTIVPDYVPQNAPTRNPNAVDIDR